MIFKYAKGANTGLVTNYLVDDDLVFILGDYMFFVTDYGGPPPTFGIGFLNLYMSSDFGDSTVHTMEDVEVYFLNKLKDLHT